MQSFEEIPEKMELKEALQKACGVLSLLNQSTCILISNLISVHAELFGSSKEISNHGPRYDLKTLLLHKYRRQQV